MYDYTCHFLKKSLPSSVTTPSKERKSEKSTFAEREKKADLRTRKKQNVANEAEKTLEEDDHHRKPPRAERNVLWPIILRAPLKSKQTVEGEHLE